MTMSARQLKKSRASGHGRKSPCRSCEFAYQCQEQIMAREWQKIQDDDASISGYCFERPDCFVAERDE